MKRRRFLLWLFAAPLAVVLAMLLAAHPHLAITEPVGAEVLVVEGWMEEPQLSEVARLADSVGYKRIYTTGTVRPFTYYLKVNEAIVVRFNERHTGRIAMNVSGLPGAAFRVVANGDTVMERWVEPRPARFESAELVTADSLVITSFNSTHPDPNNANIFIKYMRMGDENIHHLQDTTILVHRDGSRIPGWATFADHCAARLVELGVRPAPIPVPAYGKPDSRSWANANHFAFRAKADGITAFDVVTVGVHARRTRELFRRACGPGTQVGVIALDDPACPRHGWWRKRNGWLLMLKELGGASEPLAVDLTR